MAEFGNGTFETVVAIGVLHHTVDFWRAMRKVARVTQPSGTIVGMVYPAPSLCNWILSPWPMMQTLRENRWPYGTVIDADERMRWISGHHPTEAAALTANFVSLRAIGSTL